MSKVKSLKSLSLVPVAILCITMPLNNIAQAGSSDKCVSLFNPDEVKAAKLLEKAPITGEERMAIEKRLQEITQELKPDAYGLETELEQLMNVSRSLIFFGDEVSSKPQYVIMEGSAGYGKTRLIRRWAKLMGFGDSFIKADIPKGQRYMPFEKLLGRGRPLNEDPVISAMRPIIDFVINLDETQNLANFEDVEKFIHDTENAVIENDPTGDKLRKLMQDREQVAMIKRSRDFWWQFGGEGTFQTKVADPSMHLTNIDMIAPGVIQAEDAMVDARAKLSRLLAEKEDKPRDTNLDAQIVQAETTVSTNDRAFRSQLARLKPILQRLKTDCTETLGETWSALSLTELYETIRLGGPDEFTSAVRANYAAKSATTTQVRFNRGIVIVTGNPVEMLDANLKKATHKNGHVDAEALRRAAINMPQQAGVDYIIQKMGPDPGWQSRWNAAKWRPKPTFGQKQWHELIRSSLVKFQDLTTKEAKLYTDKDVTITVDQSLVDYLFTSAVNGQQGPRTYFDAINEAMPVVAVRLPTQMRRHLIETGDWNNQSKLDLKMSFSLETHKLVFQDSNGKFEMSMDLTLTDENHVKSTVPTDYPKIMVAQSALYQAARAVVGSIVFESLPQHDVEAIPTAEDTIDMMWKRPDVSHLRYIKAKMMVSMAGYIAEQTSVRNRGIDISPMARMDLDYVETMLKQLNGQVEERKELEGKKYNGRTPKLHELFGWSLAEDRVIAALYKNNTAEAYRALDSEVRSILSTQKDLINALATNLLDKNVITNDQISAGFKTYAKGPRGYQAMYAVIKRLAVGPNTSTDHLMNVQQILGNEPGSIRNPLPELSDPYSLDKREFKTTKLGKFLQRISAAINNDF